MAEPGAEAGPLHRLRLRPKSTGSGSATLLAMLPGLISDRSLYISLLFYELYSNGEAYGGYHWAASGLEDGKILNFL